MSRPSLSKETPTSNSSSRPSFVKLQEKALSLLPARRSPTKAATPSTSASTASISKRSNPFNIFSRHKPSASAPAAVHFQPARPPSISQPPPVPPKSAPATRTAIPLAPPKDGSSSQPGSQSLRSRPTVPFATSNVLRPTAASSARTLPSVSTTSSSPPSARPPFLSHTRSASKQKAEPTLVSSPSSTSQTAPVRPRVSPSPTLERTSSEQQQSPSSSSPQRPRPGARTPTSPPSAFAMKPAPHSLPSRLLPRKRSKTFPDPNDPVVPVPPQSRAMKTANRIVEAFEPSPRADDEVATSPISPIPQPSARSKSTSPTPLSPVRPIRPPQDAAFMAIPSRARAMNSGRIVPSAASIEASASRGARPAFVGPQSPTRPTLISSRSAPIAPHHRSASEQSLPPPPRKVMPVNITSSGNIAQARRTTKSATRPNLRPLNTTPVTLRGGSASNIQVVRSPSPVTPETRESSASPKTPAPNVDLAYYTSDDESKSKNKRTFKSMFGLKRPDSLVSSTTYTSAVSGSGTSNASNAFGSPRPAKMHKAPSTFGGGLAEEDDVPMMAMQTRHGIKRHGHPVSEAPYPISFEEIALQGEKHTQELLTTVLQQKAWRFTPMDNFSKSKNILDIGCGRGYWLTEAVKECKAATLVGFDLVNVFMSQQDMRQRLKLSDQQISRIEFVQGNFFNTLPFQNDRFDYIRLAFLELAIPESKWVPLLKEAWRILKPGGHIEVVIESQLFPTVWSYDKLPVQEELEDEFRGMLEKRDIPPATNIGEKMFFDAYARVQTHKHVSVCIAPRPAGRSSLDGPMSPAKFSSVRSVHSPWTSEPIMSSGLTSPSPTPYGRPSLDRSRTPVDILPPVGQLVTSKTCTVPGIVVSPDVFIPVPEDMLFTYASHGAMVLNATRLASFSDKYPDAMTDEYEEEWQKHVERYWQYERSNRLRLGFRMKQFDDDEDDDVPVVGPTHGRWKWAKCDEDLERPLEIRRFRAWSLSKPFIPRQ